MGGIGTLPMDYGQSLQVPQQMPTNFSSAQSITSNPLLNYGQPQLGQAGGTPLTMRSGGISRLGYQEGGMGMEMMQPQMQDPMMQEQMMQPPMQDQMQSQMMQGQMMQGAGGEEEGQNALLTIIQLLIEQGIDPETAKEIAGKILEAFAQGGEPAVEALANQLEQEEGMQQEPMMMAEGGLTNINRARDMLQRRAPSGEFLAYINPQEAGILRSMGGAGQDVNVSGVPSFFIKKAFKSVAKVVKSIAKSPIGMIALSIAAPYAIGAFAPGFATFGGTGILGGALRAGISNLAIQGITTGKINPKQALLAAAAGGALSGFQGATAPTGGEALYTDYGPGTGTLTDGLTPAGRGFVQPGYEPIDTGSYAKSVQVGTTPTSAPTPFESGIKSIQDFGTKTLTNVQDFGTKLMSDPVGTIGKGIGAAYDYAKENPSAVLLAATTALGALDPQQPNEPDGSYLQRKAEYDKKVAEYITQYGGGAKVYSPGASGLYAMEGAVDPFAGRSSYAADGGSISFERKTLERKGYSDMIKNMTPEEISQLYDSVMGTFSRRFQAEGSMPMGEPRRNPAGIMELDYRAKGGFVPPVGIKEKADDIPAMLSNNEFVFTADAVRNAGGGNVDQGAQRMYSLMKNLESGGRI
jgi:hypothetical protein